MFEERRLHPIALMKEIIVSIRQSIIPIIVGLFSLFRAATDQGWLPIWTYPLIILFLILLILAPALIKYATFRYALEKEGLRVRYGLIFRKNIYIPYERIQTIQQKQWFFFMPFNVTQILIETAGGSGKPEADLSAVPVQVAKELKDLRDGKKAEQDPEQTIATVETNIHKNPLDVEAPDPDELPDKTVTLRTKELILMAVTSSGVFGGLIIVLAFSGQIQDLLPKDWLESQFEQIWEMGVIIVTILVIVVLLALWGISIVATLFKYFQFKLMKYEQQLVVEKGLLQRNRTTLNFSRIQGLVIVESPLRQWLGLVGVKAITAGSSGDDEHSGDILIIPIMKKTAAYALLQELLPAYHFDRNAIERVPKTSLRYFLQIYLGWTFVLCLIPAVIFFPLGTLAFLLLFLVLWKAILSYRATGFMISERTILLQARPLFSKTTHLVRKERVQSFQLHRSIWMRRSKTCHVDMALKSGNGSARPFVRYLNEEQALRLYEWYRPQEIK
ncbi:PH domain-containing protein [Listeria ilorinensis]|uniref:PH domain-containing protein n=1 Tax=Listeria ilorinensis TaxID=2867439 RepID=UPI001EF49D5A|nr:PH domain-containing protein [Listeria ilorinensis]